MRPPKNPNNIKGLDGFKKSEQERANSGVLWYYGFIGWLEWLRPQAKGK